MLPGKRIRKGWFDRTAHAPFHTTRTPDNKTDAMLFYGHNPHAIIIFVI